MPINTLKIFKNLIFARWIFKKPNKKNILIYDRVSEIFSQCLFPKKSYEILDCRYESINIYIFCMTFLKSGIINFKDNYKKNFMEFVSPKIVFTSVDNNPAFYNLKNIYDKPFYISVQNGMRNNIFYKECKKFIQRTKKKLKADHIFLFGKNDKKKFSKIIEGDIHCSGNVINNHYLIKPSQKKINSIIYISNYGSATGLEMVRKADFRVNTLEQEKRIFGYLNKFCKKRKIKLIFCAKKKTGISLEPYLRNILAKGDWIYYPSVVRKFKTYKKLNQQRMVVFSYSTLGFEALAKGLRCVSFYDHFPLDDYVVKYPKSGVFWTNTKNYHDAEKILTRVIGLNNKRWKKIVKKYSAEILTYDPANTKMKKILKNILKKN
jgi:surface carbohydrate biosynthesis protein